MTPVSIRVTGIPATKGSARAFAFRRRTGKLGASVVNDNPRGKAWQALVSMAAAQAMEGRPPTDGPVVVRAVFLFQRPAGHWNKHGLKTTAPRWATSRQLGDVDKLARCLLDGLIGVVVADDSQVVMLTAEKQWTQANEAPGARVMVCDAVHA